MTLARAVSKEQCENYVTGVGESVNEEVKLACINSPPKEVCYIENKRDGWICFCFVVRWEMLYNINIRIRMFK